MPLILDIPDEILEALKLPPEKAEKELKRELAFLLYQQGISSMGVARRLAGMSKWEFIEGLAEKGILRHYGVKELTEDLDYAKSSE